ncbi:Down syndrome cell adhesion molecule-like protein, partial [Fragariocoptes setiger]
MSSVNEQQQQQDSAAGGKTTAGGMETGLQVARRMDELESQLVAPYAHRIDSGSYTCVARNAFGVAERHTRLLVLEVPDEPRSLEPLDVGARSIRLRWRAPFDGHTPITRYLIEYRQLLSDSIASTHQQQQQQINQQANNNNSHDNNSVEKWAIFEVPMLLSSAATHTAAAHLALQSGTASLTQASPLDGSHVTQSLGGSVLGEPLAPMALLSGLTPLTRYAIRVVAVNALGQSAPSATLILRTEEEVVPSNVHATMATSRALKLTWAIVWPNHKRELIDGFFIGYRRSSTNVAPSRSSTATTTTNALNVSPQSPTTGTFNSEQQQQQNLYNNDKQEPTFIYKTIRLLQASISQQQQQMSPNGAFGARAPHVSQVAPSMEKQIGGMGENNYINYSPELYEYTINGLERDTEYTIMIQCFNRKGAGPASDAIVARTLAADPPERVILNAEHVTESTIRLSWRLAHELSSEFTSSNVSSSSTSLIDNSNNNMVDNLPTNNPANKATNSSPPDGFVVSYALAPAGTSSHQQVAFAEQQTTDTSTSSKSIKQLSHSSPLTTITNTIQASSVNSNNNVVKHHLTQAAPIMAVTWHVIQVDGAQRGHELRELECGATYLVRAWAFNKLGQGEPSDTLSVRTRGSVPSAPDKRTFMAVNTTYVRLHLSAWLDGGCDITNYVIQYKPSLVSSHDWVLLSNRIQREQVNVIIKDLAPGTWHDLLVAATNRVGTTQVKYRFATLTLDGATVAPLSSLYDDDDDEDYSMSNENNNNNAIVNNAYNAANGKNHNASGNSSLGALLNASWRSMRRVFDSIWWFVLALVASLLLVLLLLLMLFSGSTTSVCLLNTLVARNNNPSNCSPGHQSSPVVMSGHSSHADHQVTSSSAASSTTSVSSAPQLSQQQQQQQQQQQLLHNSAVYQQQHVTLASINPFEIALQNHDSPPINQLYDTSSADDSQHNKVSTFELINQLSSNAHHHYHHHHNHHHSIGRFVSSPVDGATQFATLSRAQYELQHQQQQMMNNTNYMHAATLRRAARSGTSNNEESLQHTHRFASSLEQSSVNFNQTTDNDLNSQQNHSNISDYQRQQVHQNHSIDNNFDERASGEQLPMPNISVPSFDLHNLPVHVPQTLVNANDGNDDSSISRMATVCATDDSASATLAAIARHHEQQQLCDKNQCLMGIYDVPYRYSNDHDQHNAQMHHHQAANQTVL